MKYVIRDLVPDDLRFVMSEWLRTWRVSKHAGVVRNHVIVHETRALIEDLFARGMKVLVADEGRTLMGFVAYEVKEGQAIVHYLFTKDLYLQLPVADRLLDAIPATRPGHFSFYNRKLDRAGWTWSPEICRRKSL